MRRLCLVMLFALVALPVMAQDQTPVWDLSADNYLDVQDLGFRFYYPLGWVWGSGDNGIAIAETQADVDAQLDDDSETRPKGKIITILGVPLAALPEEVLAGGLDTVTDFVVESGDIAETERFELPVMARRSIWVTGENSSGRFGVGTFWLQNGYLILTSLGAPDEPTISESIFTWGFTIGSIEPLAAEDLGDGALVSDVSQFTMNYPDSWTADTDLLVFELLEEMSSDVTSLKGIFLSVADQPLADLDFEADATLEDVSTSLAGAFGLDETATHEEFVFLDQPAIVSWGEIDDGSGGKRGLILTSSVVDGNAVVFVLLAPTVERAAEFMPTWVAMMQSVTSTAA